MTAARSDLANRAADERAAGRCLLIVRAGDASLHPAWLEGTGAPRNWDLHVSYYGDAAAPFADRPADVTLSHEKGLKFLGIAACLDKLGERLAGYDYIGFADDDLWAERQTWNRLFDIVRRYRPVLAQPALDPRSFFSFDELIAQPAFLLRWTDFVEEQAPIFSAQALAKVRGDFTVNQSGWGLDMLWTRDLATHDRALCVIDAAPILHTRALYTGSLYRLLKAQGAPTPREEMNQLIADNGITHRGIHMLGAVAPDGQEIARPTLSSLPIWGARLRRKYRLLRGIKSIGPKP